MFIFRFPFLSKSKGSSSGTIEMQIQVGKHPNLFSSSLCFLEGFFPLCFTCSLCICFPELKYKSFHIFEERCKEGNEWKQKQQLVTSGRNQLAAQPYLNEWVFYINSLGCTFSHPQTVRTEELGFSESWQWSFHKAPGKCVLALRGVCFLKQRAPWCLKCTIKFKLSVDFLTGVFPDNCVSLFTSSS